MMATVESWSGNIADIGPIYPMVGTEMILVLIMAVAWILWHIVQAKQENRTYEEQEKKFSDLESQQRIVDGT